MIYARVSSVAQTKRGDGLGSQETRCREYARQKGYSVEEVFTDDVTGQLATRPGVQAMLQFLNVHRHERPVVIIDDITRLARDVIAHWELREVIEKAGGRLESPSIAFGQDSDSILIENLLASVSQHQRQKNAEQTKNRMRARAMNGYWCFQAPVGYRYERKGGHGKLLVRDEPCASILQEALEGFAYGRFQTQAEVQRFLEACPAYPKDPKTGRVHPQRVTEILTRSLYAGMIEVPNWNVPIRKGHHEGLILLDTFRRIQDRLQEAAVAPSRKDLHLDFPLRGAISCADCGNPLTAAWSSGKSRKYAYYACHRRDCASRRKSIPRDQLEGDFLELLERLGPSRDTLSLVRGMFCDAWNQRREQTASARRSLQTQIDSLSQQIESLLERIINAASSSVIHAYEKRVAALETDKLLLEEQLDFLAPTADTFEEKFEHAMQLLANPLELWLSDDFEKKRTLLKLAFDEHPAYCRERGFRTPEFSIPFKVLAEFSGSDIEMAHLEGESLNQLFEALADWNRQLTHHWSDAVQDQRASA